MTKPNNTELKKIIECYSNIESGNESVQKLLVFKNLYGKVSNVDNARVLVVLNLFYLTNPESCKAIISVACKNSNFSYENFISEAIEQFLQLQIFLYNRYAKSVLTKNFQFKNALPEPYKELEKLKNSPYLYRKYREFGNETNEILSQVSAKLKPLKKSINHLVYYHEYEYRLGFAKDPFNYSMLTVPEGEDLEVNYKYDPTATKKIHLFDEIASNFYTEKINNIEKKEFLYHCATGISVGIAAGEGGVACAAIFAFLSVTLSMPLVYVVPIAVVTLLAGAILNFYLIRDDTYDVLVKLFVKNFIADLSLCKKIIAAVLGSFAIASGLAYGCLQASSLYSGILMPTLAAMHVPLYAAMYLSIGLTTLPVLITTIGFSAIFFCAIAKLIESDFHMLLWEYIKRNFTDKAWSDMSMKQQAMEACFSMLEFLKIFVTASIVSTIMIAGFGVFNSRCAGILSVVMSLSIAEKIAVAIACINSIIYFIFDINKVYSLVTMFSEAVKSWFDRSNEAENIQINSSARMAKYFMLALGGICLVLNCGAQGVLFSTEPGPLAVTFGQAVGRWVAGIAEFLCSASENGTSYIASQANLFNIPRIEEDEVNDEMPLFVK